MDADALAFFIEEHNPVTVDIVPVAGGESIADVQVVWTKKSCSGKEGDRSSTDHRASCLAALSDLSSAPEPGGTVSLAGSEWQIVETLMIGCVACRMTVELSAPTGRNAAHRRTL